MNILYFHIISFFLLSFLLLFLVRNKFSKKVFIVLITIQCILIVGLRDVSVGVDTFRYSMHFINSVQDFNYVINQSDIGYFFLQNIIGIIIGGNFNLWLLFVSILIYTPLGILIYKYSSNVFLSYLIYFSLEFFFFNFSGMRQSIAIIGILLSYVFIINKKPIKFIITVLISATFHNTALIFLPIYWLSRKRITKTYLIYMLGFFSLVFILRYQLGELLTLFYYEDDSVFNLYESSSGIGGTAIFIMLILLLGLIFYNASIFSKDIQNIVLTNITIIALLIQLLSSFSYLFTRLNLYFLIFLVIYIPYIISNINRGNIRMNLQETFLMRSSLNLVFVSFLLSFYIYKVYNGLDMILPYEFYWANK